MVTPKNASQRVQQHGFCSQALAPVITPSCACLYQLQARSPRGRPCGGRNKCVLSRVCRTPPPYYFWRLAATIALERTLSFLFPPTRRTPPLVVFFVLLSIIPHSRMPVHARCSLLAAYLVCVLCGSRHHRRMVKRVYVASPGRLRVSLLPLLCINNLLAPLFRSVAWCGCLCSRLLLHQGT